MDGKVGETERLLQWLFSASFVVTGVYVALLFLYPERDGSFLWLFLLVPPALQDGLTGYISDTSSGCVALCALATAFLDGTMLEVGASVFVMGVLYGILYVVSRGQLGMGDVVLSLAISLWLTWPWALVFLWVSSVSAILFAVGKRFREGRWPAMLRFGPFLCIGGGVAYVWQTVVGRDLASAFGLFTF